MLIPLPLPLPLHLPRLFLLFLSDCTKKRIFGHKLGPRHYLKVLMGKTMGKKFKIKKLPFWPKHKSIWVVQHTKRSRKASFWGVCFLTFLHFNHSFMRTLRFSTLAITMGPLCYNLNRKSQFSHETIMKKIRKKTDPPKCCNSVFFCYVVWRILMFLGEKRHFLDFEIFSYCISH